MTTNIVANRDDHRAELLKELETEFLSMTSKAAEQAGQSIYREGIADGLSRALAHVQRKARS